MLEEYKKLAKIAFSEAVNFRADAAMLPIISDQYKYDIWVPQVQKHGKRCESALK